MLWQPHGGGGAAAASSEPRWPEPVVGGALGFLAGIVGIGGGIFLAPLLYMLRWGRAKAIAGTCAVFILVNSIAGLVGQLRQERRRRPARRVADPLAAVPGGAGRRADRLDARQRPARPANLSGSLTALLILYVAVRLAMRFFARDGAGR